MYSTLEIVLVNQVNEITEEHQFFAYGVAVKAE